MYVLTPEQMRKADRYAIDTLGIPERKLMDNAAVAMFEEIMRLDGNSAVIFAGKGNNGADSMLLADLLKNAAWRVRLILIPETSELGTVQQSVLDDISVIPERFDESTDTDADIIVDGIFGTGFKGKPEGRYEKAIEKIRRSHGYVVAADLPSGLEPESGMAPGTYVKADLTVSFGAAKTGFFQNTGPETIGKLVVKDIGIPESAFASTGAACFLANAESISHLVPQRRIDSNKGDYGKTYIFAGSENMPGAGVLSSRAAYRAGAGYVFYRAADWNRTLMTSVVPEAIPSEKLPDICKSAAIGPGCETDERLMAEVRRAAGVTGLKLILDAGALRLPDIIDIFSAAKARILLTPHPGEMAAMLGTTSDRIQADRINICRQFAMQHRVVVLLKGYRTVISDEKGTVYIIQAGNDSLAKAGTGDVLTGLAAGFSAYMDLFEAAVLSAYIHGYCADKYVEKYSRFSLTAAELLGFLPEAMRSAGIG